MIAAGAAAGAAASYYGVCELAYNRFISRGPKFFAMGPQKDALTEEQRAERRQRQEAVQSWFAASQVQDLTLTSFDGLRLHATQILNHPDSDKWIVMAHGYGADSLAGAEWDTRTLGAMPDNDTDRLVIVALDAAVRL